MELRCHSCRSIIIDKEGIVKVLKQYSIPIIDPTYRYCCLECAMKRLVKLLVEIDITKNSEKSNGEAKGN